MTAFGAFASFSSAVAKMAPSRGEIRSGTARQYRMCVTACAVFLVLHSAVSFAGDVTELPGLSRQTLQLTVTSTAEGTKTLEALVVRPDTPGPFPLALITHGLPRSSTEIPAMRPELYISPAIVFAQHGYALSCAPGTVVRLDRSPRTLDHASNAPT